MSAPTPPPPAPVSPAEPPKVTAPSRSPANAGVETADKVAALVPKEIG